jgi:hypothetical protein
MWDCRRLVAEALGLYVYINEAFRSECWKRRFAFPTIDGSRSYKIHASKKRGEYLKARGMHKSAYPPL